MIGQVLNVKERIPNLSVRTVEHVTYHEAIPCPVEKVEDKTMYKGDTKIMIQGEEGDALVTGSVDKIPAKNLSDTVYVAAGYMSGGKSYCTGVLAYSIGAFCTTKADDPTAEGQPLAPAIAIYGYYAKLYFSGVTG